MNVKITSTLIHAISLCYRMPSKAGEKANPVLEVNLPPRALLKDVAFPNDDYFEAFKKQNQQYIDNGTIIIGATTAKKAEKAHEQNVKDEKQNVISKIDNTTSKLETSAKGAKGKMSIKVKKDDAS